MIVFIVRGVGGIVKVQEKVVITAIQAVNISVKIVIVHTVRRI